jgi:hypothetical protein
MTHSTHKEIDRHNIWINPPGNTNFSIKQKVCYNDPSTGALGKIVEINGDILGFGVENVTSLNGDHLYATTFKIKNEDEFPDITVVSLTEELTDIMAQLDQNFMNSSEEQFELLSDFSSVIKNYISTDIDCIVVKSTDKNTGDVNLKCIEKNRITILDTDGFPVNSNSIEKN